MVLAVNRRDRRAAPAVAIPATYAIVPVPERVADHPDLDSNRARPGLKFNQLTQLWRRKPMATTTNHLVANAKKLVRSRRRSQERSCWARHSLPDTARCTRRSAMPLDDNSISALTSLDHAMEAVASKVTPAVVNVAVTSRGPSEEESSNDNGNDDQDQQGQMQQLPPGTAAVLRQHVSPDAEPARRSNTAWAAASSSRRMATS